MTTGIVRAGAAKGGDRRLPPRPPFRDLFGNLRRNRGRWHRFLAECAESGDVVRVPTGGPLRCVLLAHPRDVEGVLVTHHRNFTKHFAIRRNRTTFGDGLMSSEGKPWIEQRRRAQPAFARSRHDAYAAAIVEETERMLTRWRDGERRDAAGDMKELTMAIMTRLILGAPDEEITRAASTAMEAFTRRSPVLYLFPERAPAPGNLRLTAAVRRLDGLVAERIADRRWTDSSILAEMERAAASRGGTLSAAETRDAVVTLLQAGHHATTAGLAWMWHLLDRHPADRAAVEEEIHGVLGNRLPEAGDVERLAHAGNVVRESLRVRPPVWCFGRRAIDAFEAGGYRIPARTTVIVSPWVTHRDLRWFDEPQAFRPERWSEGLERRLPRYAFFPFSGGPRQCIGDALAVTEMVLVLATVARRFRLHAPPGRDVVARPGFTLLPRGGLPMDVRAS